MPELKHGMIVDEHLGGYVPGGDPDTWYPDLWRWLIDDQGVKSMIDVGCGEGQTIDWFAANGCDVIGIDGIDQNHPDFVKHDYTTGRLLANPRVGRTSKAQNTAPHEWADLCWSAEFVEHVEERYVPNFLDTFACAKLVMMTHAVPGQGGWHHVNCRTSDYWIGAMAAVGYQLDHAMTTLTRALAAANGQATNYYRDTGLAFRKNAA